MAEPEQKGTSTTSTPVETQDTNENDTMQQSAIAQLRQEINASSQTKVEVPQSEHSFAEMIILENIQTKKNSEAEYIKIVKKVVQVSETNLTEIRSDKQELRTRLVSFCINALGVQLAVLCIFILLSAALPTFEISDNVLMTFMTAVLVETLGAIIVMVQFAFKAEEEVEVIKILNAIVGNYQKFKDSDVEKKTEDNK